ncbi:hypothetical protein ACFL9T_22415, partial [Thermodesulfobacteriota bacterium]
QGVKNFIGLYIYLTDFNILEGDSLVKILVQNLKESERGAILRSYPIVYAYVKSTDYSDDYINKKMISDTFRIVSCLKRHRRDIK